MSSDIETTSNLENFFPFKEAEPKLYARWMERNVFATDPKAEGEPFSIVFPPPNVTGSLHLGHALTFTLQDVLIRYKRSKRYNVHWQAGTDHAGIATQMIVERTLREKGIEKNDIGREAFIEKAWEWKEQSGGDILRQLRCLGASPDWERERFTLDEGLNEAVRKVFVQLYKEGLIYRDNRLVNWDPKHKTAVSDLEVDNKETNGSLWHIRYPLEKGGDITIATTRPETLLGDTAIAVHPDNKKLNKLIGTHAIIPLLEKKIPIVGDEHADPEKGTGAVKITPAHDFNDFEVGQRHNLPKVTILGEEACISLSEIEDDVKASSEKAFLESLKGIDRFDARKKLLVELEAKGFLTKTEPHVLQVPHAERGGAVIEPRLTVQWYCDAATLAKPAIEAVKSGEMKFQPALWENTFFAWMRDLKPWCISRQLWWGHRIPAWYDEKGNVFVAETEEEARKQAGKDAVLTADPDVLDTWFSSSLWPFSSLGWPEKTEELERYYPTSVLVTGFDIIFFWVARMMMMGFHFMKKPPFETILIHGLVRDEHGQKMSKSKGNGIDPIDLINTYGADPVRLAICLGAGVGRDVRLGEKIVEEQRSFITKLWNAARLLEMKGVFPKGWKEAEKQSVEDTRHTRLGSWTLSEINKGIAAAEEGLNNYRFDEYALQSVQLVRNHFCDQFLELAKIAFDSVDKDKDVERLKRTTRIAFGKILRLLQPMIPFVTADLWEKLGYGSSVGFERVRFGKPSELTKEEQLKADDISWLLELISQIRTIRGEIGAPPAKKGPLYCENLSGKQKDILLLWKEALSRLARVSHLEWVNHGQRPANAPYFKLGEGGFFLGMDGVIDFGAELARLEKEKKKDTELLDQAHKKLGNKAFIERAKPEVVAETKERIVILKEKIAGLDKAMGYLKG